jgi:hypothetical protein
MQAYSYYKIINVIYNDHLNYENVMERNKINLFFNTGCKVFVR